MGLCVETDTEMSQGSWGRYKHTFPLTLWGHTVYAYKGQYGVSLPFLFHLLVSLTQYPLFNNLPSHIPFSNFFPLQLATPTTDTFSQQT
jgi:hypothetical protein